LQGEKFQLSREYAAAVYGTKNPQTEKIVALRSEKAEYKFPMKLDDAKARSGRLGPVKSGSVRNSLNQSRERKEKETKKKKGRSSRT